MCKAHILYHESIEEIVTQIGSNSGDTIPNQVKVFYLESDRFGLPQQADPHRQNLKVSFLDSSRWL
jgi:hypothetical protein